MQNKLVCYAVMHTLLLYRHAHAAAGDDDTGVTQSAL